jgi:nitrogenase molybdenum-iron protein beta chain
MSRESPSLDTAALRSDGPAATEAPRWSCALGGALTTTLGIFGAVPILHAGAGCGLGQQFGLTYAAGENAGGPQGGTNTPCSSLVEEHVIFGGEDKLRSLIASSLQLMKGELFAVISGCIPSLIGDDVDAVVREFRDQASLVHVKAPGFGGTSYDGYELLLEALVEQHVTPRPKVKGRVNLLGVVPYQHLFWKGELAVLKEELAAIGVEANILFTEFNGPELVRNLSEAELTVVLSPWNGHRVAEKLKQKFDIPWIAFPSVPVGGKQTTSFLRRVAAELGLDRGPVETSIRAAQRHSYRFLEYAGDGLILGLPHAYFAVVADAGTAIGITQFLTNEIAYLPDIVIIADGTPEAARAEVVRQLTEGLDIAGKPEIIFESDAHVIRQRLKGHHFLFLLASSLEKHTAGEEYGALHHSISFPSYDRLVLDTNYAGFRGGLKLLEELSSKWIGPL